MDPCLSGVFTFAVGFISPNPVYVEVGVPEVISFDNVLGGDITNSATSAICTNFIYSVTNDDYSAIEGSIFTLSGDTFTLTINTNDLSHDGTYNLKVSAQFVGAAYSPNGEYDLTVILTDPCDTATLTIDSANAAFPSITLTQVVN